MRADREFVDLAVQSVAAHLPVPTAGCEQSFS